MPLPFPLCFLFPHLFFTCPHFSHDSWFTHSTLNTDSPTPGMPPLLHSHPQPLHPLTPSPPGWLFFPFLLSIWIIPTVVFSCTFKNCFYAISSFVSLSFYEIVKKRREFCDSLWSRDEFCSFQYVLFMPTSFTDYCHCMETASWIRKCPVISFKII